MAGRLDQYDSFVATARGVSEGVREPVREDAGLRSVKDVLDGVNPEILFSRSREERIPLEVYYNKIVDGRPMPVKRIVVVPKKRLMRRFPYPLYVEVVDYYRRRRRPLRRDRIHKVVPAKGVRVPDWDPDKARI